MISTSNHSPAFAWLWLLLGCSSPVERAEAQTAPIGSSAPSPKVLHSGAAPASGPQASRTTGETRTSPAVGGEAGAADLDPDNDLLVAPPEPLADCETRLQAAGVRYRKAELKLRQRVRSTYTCGAPQVVIYERGPGEISYSAPPLVTCGLALALARFELLLQVEAERALGARIKRIQQGGTYSCRKMTRFSSMVSEHSYANAIDIYGFVAENGKSVSVKRHFGRLDTEPVRAEGQFLRALARQSYDRGLFSVVLTPFFDKLHSDHLHVDLARYRVDGTRP